MKQVIFNRETLKIELHFDKADYTVLSDDEKARVKSAFLWSKRGGCWVSWAKEPNLYEAKRIARDLGFGDVEKVGERLTFAEQVERDRERAENRAERYEGHAERATDRAEALQRPMNEHHGDISFFTQPYINSSAGRSFKRYRERVYAQFEKGIDEYRKSEYWKQRAETARQTAAGAKYSDSAYLERKIKECNLNLKHMESTLSVYDKVCEKLSNGETVKHKYSGEEWTLDELNDRGSDLLERMEAERDKLAYLMDRFDEMGGNRFTKENVKPGYIVRIPTFGAVEVLSVGKSNFVARTKTGTVFTVSLVEIQEIVEAKERVEAVHPFVVGDTFTIKQWNGDTTDYKIIKVTYKIIKVTDKSVTLQTEGGKPFVRRPSPSRVHDGMWGLTITDGYQGTVFKTATDN